MNSYDSYSDDLSQIADRRRIGLWIGRKEYEIFDSNHDPIQVKIIRPLTDPYLISGLPKETRIVLDLVDGYLVENVSTIKDYLRYFLRTSKPKSLIHPKKFSESLKYICANADLIVVASDEQAEIAKKINSNIRVIRDSHEELGQPMYIERPPKRERYNIFWEGLGFTLFHFKEVAPELTNFLISTNSLLHLVTNKSFPRYANRFGNVDSKNLIKKLFGPASSRVQIYEWNPEMVKKISKKCDFGVIPIRADDSFARLKPENKLLIYWRLGLPTLFSDTPAYVRVASKIGMDDYGVESGAWGRKLFEFSQKDFDATKMQEVQRYLLEYHSEAIILEQWKQALESLANS